MELWTDIINPADLTGFARETAETYDQGSLAALLPNIPVDDVVFSWNVGEKVTDVAEYRSFDAETPIGNAPGVEQKTARLAPLGLKKRFSEYDQLRRRSANSPETVQAAADRLAAEVARATVDRAERARGEALVTGKLAINENGFIQNVDFGRRADFTITAVTLWSAAGASPLDDLEAWNAAYIEENGTAPTSILVSSRVMSALVKKLRDQLGAGAPTVFTRNNANEIIAGYGLPVPTVYDRRVGGARVTADDRVIFAGTGVGGTVWGTTVEADDPRYNLTGGDLPGMVVGAYNADDPATKWVRANAIALPILGDPNLSLAARVL
ncbi:major capsid protein [Saxibacter everestensis]|uniref:Major capsid protein n=1 Tax=Saxibacter everestensis TaxID=2909229 RepID=A0ABY8QX01_9MICO|nr:major capsid protein [Brevibacteriaceae bacterium ZFBP1038]